MGAVFDRDREGQLLLAREGGHSLARVVHAGGAATGAEIERALVDEVRATAAAVWERWFALDLLVERRPVPRRGGPRRRRARRHEIRARHVLLATGGAGPAVRRHHQPASQSTGDGLAMALRAGVPCADVEFMQFHPTALFSPRMPRPLLSEALRGHGALIRDRDGERFVDELQPRDVVARAITAKLHRARHRPRLARRHRPRALRRALPHHRRRAARRPASTRPPTGCRSPPPPTTTAAACVTDLRGRHRPARAVGGGRGGRHRRARRQPAGVELAPRGHGLRAPGHRGHRPGRRRSRADGRHARRARRHHPARRHRRPPHQHPRPDRRRHRPKATPPPAGPPSSAR